MRKFFLISFNILRIVTIFLRLHNILDLISDLFLYFEYEVSLRTVHPQRQFVLRDSSSWVTVHPQWQFILRDSSSSKTVHPEWQFILSDSSSWGWIFSGWTVSGWIFSGWTVTGWTVTEDELSLRMNCLRTNCLWGWTDSGWIFQGWTVSGWTVLGWTVVYSKKTCSIRGDDFAFRFRKQEFVSE